MSDLPPPTSPEPDPDWVRFGMPEDFVDAVQVGRGGFGYVFRAQELSLSRTVAIKILNQPSTNEKADQRFTRELQAMGTLAGHPHIITVYTWGKTDGGYPYIVMAYMSGGSLKELVDNEGVLPWARAFGAGIKVAGALETAHRHGILHRDIKPENILLNGFGEPALGDFGIARITGGTETATGSITGSLSHVSPEVLEGNRPTAASDVYSLASTLFALIEGKPAFASEGDETLTPMLARILLNPVPPITAQEVPAEVISLLEAGLAKKPEDRLPSIEAFGEEMRALLEAHNQPAPTMLIRGDAHSEMSASGVKTGEYTARSLGAADIPTVDRDPATDAAAAAAAGTAAGATAAGAASAVPPTHRVSGSVLPPTQAPTPTPSAPAGSRKGLFVGIAAVLIAGLAIVGGVVVFGGGGAADEPTDPPTSETTSASDDPSEEGTEPSETETADVPKETQTGIEFPATETVEPTPTPGETPTEETEEPTDEPEPDPAPPPAAPPPPPPPPPPTPPPTFRAVAP